MFDQIMYPYFGQTDMISYPYILYYDTFKYIYFIYHMFIKIFDAYVRRKPSTWRLGVKTFSGSPSVHACRRPIVESELVNQLTQTCHNKAIS